VEISILDSVKSKVNLTTDNHEFDDEIIDYINSAFATLHQAAGVGPIQGFAIEDAMATWDDFLQGDNRLLGVKEYVAKKVRMAFDPPGTSFHLKALQDVIAELEWRLNVVRESTVYGIPLYNHGGSVPTTPTTDSTLNGGSPIDDGGEVLDGGAP
jgi:hypothetical protein